MYIIDDMKFDDDKINEEANTHEKEIEASKLYWLALLLLAYL